MARAKKAGSNGSSLNPQKLNELRLEGHLGSAAYDFVQLLIVNPHITNRDASTALRLPAAAATGNIVVHPDRTRMRLPDVVGHARAHLETWHSATINQDYLGGDSRLRYYALATKGTSIAREALSSARRAIQHHHRTVKKTELALRAPGLSASQAAVLHAAHVDFVDAQMKSEAGYQKAVMAFPTAGQLAAGSASPPSKADRGLIPRTLRAETAAQASRRIDAAVARREALKGELYSDHAPAPLPAPKGSVEAAIRGSDLPKEVQDKLLRQMKGPDAS